MLVLGSMVPGGYRAVFFSGVIGIVSWNVLEMSLNFWSKENMIPVLQSMVAVTLFQVTADF